VVFSIELQVPPNSSSLIQSPKGYYVKSTNYEASYFIIFKSKYSCQEFVLKLEHFIFLSRLKRTCTTSIFIIPLKTYVL